jgi:hydrogenase maturation protease
MSAKLHQRIIGIGNRDRGDDGVGLFVAERLREFGLPAIAYEGDPLALAHLWGPDDHVLLIDAVLTGAPPGTLHFSNASEISLSRTPPASSHGFDVAQGIELARILGRLPASLRVCGIEAECLDMKVGLTPRVREAAAIAIEQILRDLSLFQETSSPDSESEGFGHSEGTGERSR